MSCVSTTWCMVAGSYGGSSGTVDPAAEVWSGGSEWTSTPLPSPGASNYFDAVSCTSETYCVAVGFYIQATTNDIFGLAATWNGSSWSEVTNFSFGQDVFLEGVSCVKGSSYCKVVGYLGVYSVTYTVNGGEWSADPGSPFLNTTAYGVSCVTADFCVQVGSQGGAPWGMQWSGSSWANVTLPGRSSGVPFEGVSCPTISSCVAVGQYLVIAGRAHTPYEQIDTWNGGSWISVTPPNPNHTAQMYGVSCQSIERCVAVGETSRDKVAVSFVQVGPA